MTTLGPMLGPARNRRRIDDIVVVFIAKIEEIGRGGGTGGRTRAGTRASTRRTNGRRGRHGKSKKIFFWEVERKKRNWGQVEVRCKVEERTNER